MTEIRRRGLLLVLSSPSGAGKTTITRRLLDRDPLLRLSISVTTRPKRPGEVDGADYYFVTPAEFERMVRGGELLESALVFGHSYGTPKKPVEEALRHGRDVVFDIDWQGTQQLAQNAPDDLVSIFVLPPSIEELAQRLRGRAQDSDEVVASRMAKASDEMSHWAEYKYIVVNRDLDESLRDVQSILAAERLKRSRRIGLADFVTGLRKGG
ncbi:MAG: guanylate kinase [Alphaproteobacteria bacterium]